MKVLIRRCKEFNELTLIFDLPWSFSDFTCLTPTEGHGPCVRDWIKHDSKPCNDYREAYNLLESAGYDTNEITLVTTLSQFK